MKKVYVIIPIFAMLVVALLAGIIGLTHDRKSNTVNNTQIQMQNIPRHAITFIENRGQWGTPIEFMVRKPGMTAWLQRDGVTFQFEKREERDKVKGIVMSIAFEGASEQVVLSGKQEQTANYNFFIGNDRSKWQSNVAGYAKVMYHRLYEGIDLCFREDNGWLEYDLLLSRSADLSDVVIRCEGLKELRIDENGILVMETEFGPITQKPPKAWYELASGGNLPVECQFRKIDEHSYGFYVPERDVALALVIDPGLEWSTFLGGQDQDDCISIDLTASGDIIIAGATESVDFPTTTGAYDTTFVGGYSDAYISCISADGSQLLWSTFLGGDSIDVLFEVALDDSDRVVVGGLTMSSDFPATPGAYDTTHNGAFDGVVACLSADGSQLLYSTYLGTTMDDMIVALDVSNSGDAIVGGYTASSNFPTTPGAYDTTYNGGIRDAFVTRLSADGSTLVYSTYLGGNNDDGWYYEYPMITNSDYIMLVLDEERNVFITGSTLSPDFPTTPGAYDTTFNGDWDNFITKLDATGSNLIYSTYLGGSSLDYTCLDAISLSENGMLAIGGVTWSSDFPTTPNAYDTTFNGGAGDFDAFVSILDSTGSQLLYSTFIGGTGGLTGDVVTSMAFDPVGNVLIAGQCEYGFPTTPGAYDTTLNGPYDAFVGLLSPNGNGQADLVYCSYIGGNSSELAGDLAIIDDSTVVLIGSTVSSNFPTTPFVYDETFNGVKDGFILRFGVYVGIQEDKTNEPVGPVVLGPVFPNPSQGKFNYSINLTKPTHARVCIIDVTGRLVETLIDEQLSAGVHDFMWKPDKKLPSGIYYLHLDTEDGQQSRKFIMMK